MEETRAQQILRLINTWRNPSEHGQKLGFYPRYAFRKEDIALMIKALQSELAKERAKHDRRDRQ